MNVLVTGSSGYVGSQLVPGLVAQGHRVVGVDRVSGDARHLSRFIRGDLMEKAVLDESLENVSCIVHLSAAKADWGLSEEEYFRDNLEVSRRLLEAGRQRGVGDWVFFSTVSTMGPSQTPIDEKAGLHPIEPYGRSKARAEEAFQEFAAQEPRARVLIIRPSVIYGPENPPSTNIFRLIDGLYRRRFIMVGDGHTVKTTSYIENTVAATLFLMTRKTSGLNTAIYVDEPALETGDLIRRICKLLGRRPPHFRVPLPLASVLAVPADVLARVTSVDLPITSARIRKFCRSTVFDAGQVRREGFRQPVDNDTALARTVDWYLSSVAGGRTDRGTSSETDHAGR